MVQVSKVSCIDIGSFSVLIALNINGKWSTQKHPKKLRWKGTGHLLKLELEDTGS